MPTLRELGLDVDPTDEPLRYPGDVVRHHALLVGDTLRPLHPVGTSGRPGADLVVDDGARPARPLDSLLDDLGVAPCDDRRPVLAVGSNAAPAQLRHKFAPLPGPRVVVLVVVLVVVEVTGLAVAHSAHVSRPGYVPYAPVVAPGARRRLTVPYLDAAQLRRLDETEPNYGRIPLPPGVRVVPPGGAPLTGCDVYRGRHGLLRAAPGAPPLAATTQPRVLGLLADLPWFADLVPESRAGPDAAVAALRRDGARRDAVRLALARHGHRAGDGPWAG